MTLYNPGILKYLEALMFGWEENLFWMRSSIIEEGRAPVVWGVGGGTFLLRWRGAGRGAPCLGHLPCSVGEASPTVLGSGGLFSWPNSSGK